VLAANAGSMRELRLLRAHVRSEGEGEADPATSPDFYLAALVAAAPHLEVLVADAVGCWWKDAPLLMRAEPPFAPLRLRTLEVSFCDGGALGGLGGFERVAPFTAALADAALQPALADLWIVHAETQRPEVLDALVDAVLARSLRTLRLLSCTPPAAAPLARLLSVGVLAKLMVWWTPPAAPLFDAAGAALVADALRATTALTSLKLEDVKLHLDMDAAAVFLAALVGHPSLRKLELNGERTAPWELADDPIALGAALAALVAADAPALQALRISDNALGDAGLAPLVAALPRNRHLRKLNINQNGMSERFARKRLLPAVRANTGLQKLLCASETEYDDREEGTASAEAEELVERRQLHNS
jgi:hypothetical protein